MAMLSDCVLRARLNPVLRFVVSLFPARQRQATVAFTLSNRGQLG